MSRQDEYGRAFAGSQLQLQIYVNRRLDELNSRILSELNPKPPVGSTLIWASPLEADRFREYCDVDFLRALGLDRFTKELSDFWPKGGPNWDGLATVRHRDKDFGYLLVEAKSYVDEMKSSCMAKSLSSLSKIGAALNRTKSWLGATENVDWEKDLYQLANRLAHLYFFREVIEQEAWLINLCFILDPHQPTSVAQWKTGLAASKKQMGLGERVSWVSDILLPACRNRSDLL